MCTWMDSVSGSWHLLICAVNGVHTGNTHHGQGSSHLSEWQNHDALPMSRSASNATGQLIENTWAPVKSAVRDSAKVCMGESPGTAATGSVSSPQAASGPGKPSMPKAGTGPKRMSSCSGALAEQAC